MAKLIGEISISEKASSIIKKYSYDKEKNSGYFKNESDFGRFALAFAISKKLDVDFDVKNYKLQNSLNTKWHYSSLDPNGEYDTILKNIHPEIDVDNDFISALIDYTIKYIDKNYFQKNIFQLSELIK